MNRFATLFKPGHFLRLGHASNASTKYFFTAKLVCIDFAHFSHTRTMKFGWGTAAADVHVAAV